MKLVQPTLDELLPTPEGRAAFEAKSAALEAAGLVRGLRRRAMSVGGTAGISQEELARRIGTSQARISQIEKGEGRDGPSYALLRRIAYACGVDWLKLVRSVVEDELLPTPTNGPQDAVGPCSNAAMLAADPAAYALGLLPVQMNAAVQSYVGPPATVADPHSGMATEAQAEPGRIWSTGLQDPSHRMAASAQAAFEATAAIFKALSGVKSLKDAMDLQATLARGAQAVAPKAMGTYSGGCSIVLTLSDSTKITLTNGV